MSKVVSDFPLIPRSNRGGVRKYPWEEWSDGQVRMLTKGEEFSTSLKVMRLSIAGRARSIGKKSRCVTDKENGVLYFKIF